MTIDVADVVSQFGAHYVDEGQNKDKIKNIPYTPSKTRALFGEIPMTGDYFKSTKAQMDTVLQPFQSTFTSKGTLEFVPNAFPLFRPKIDLKITPDTILKSYLGFLAGKPTNERADWPLIAYILEVHIPKVQDKDWEKSIAYGGKFVAPVDGTASPAADTLDGVKEVLKKYNTAGRLNLTDGPLAMGAISADPEDFCTQVEDWVDSMNPEVRAEFDIVVMSETLATRYKRGKRKKYGIQVNFLSGTGASDLQTIEDYPHLRVEGFQSHNGSDLIWSTTKENRIRPVWRNQLENVFKVESLKREVFIFTDWFEALEFEVPELVITNDSSIFA